MQGPQIGKLGNSSPAKEKSVQESTVEKKLFLNLLVCVFKLLYLLPYEKGDED